MHRPIRSGSIVKPKVRPGNSLAELLCALSFVTDTGMGQPMEHGRKTAYFGRALPDSVVPPDEDRARSSTGRSSRMRVGLRVQPSWQPSSAVTTSVRGRAGLRSSRKVRRLRSCDGRPTATAAFALPAEHRHWAGRLPSSDLRGADVLPVVAGDGGVVVALCAPSAHCRLSGRVALPLALWAVGRAVGEHVALSAPSASLSHAE